MPALTIFSIPRRARHWRRPGNRLRQVCRLAGGVSLLGYLVFGGVGQGALHAQSGGVDALVRRFEARYRGAQSLQTHFLERYTEQGRTLRLDAGVAYFRRPGKMRWEYESPEAKLFVTDGRTIWFYVPADRTVIRSRVKEDNDERTPFSLLTRNPRLDRLCASIVQGSPGEAVTAGNEVLRCRPRMTRGTQQGPREVLLEIVPETGDLSRVRVDQGGGAALEFQFSRWEKNTIKDDARFHFMPPMGTAIVNGPAEESGAGSALP